MEIKKKERIESFRSMENTVYDSCVFYGGNELFSPKSCVFKNCSFRSPITLGEMKFCSFENCNFVSVKIVDHTDCLSNQYRDISTGEIVADSFSYSIFDTMHELLSTTKTFRGNIIDYLVNYAIYSYWVSHSPTVSGANSLPSWAEEDEGETLWNCPNPITVTGTWSYNGVTVTGKVEVSNLYSGVFTIYDEAPFELSLRDTRNYINECSFGAEATLQFERTVRFSDYGDRLI